MSWQSHSVQMDKVARRACEVQNPPENFPEGKGETRDLVAKATGFGNGKTYEQAKPTQLQKLSGMFIAGCTIHAMQF